MSSNFKFTNNTVQYDFSDIFIKQEYFKDGNLFTCGYGFFGNIGDSALLSRSSLVQVSASNGWVKAIGGVGGNTTIVQDSNGTLWSWGNGYGCLNGNTANTSKLVVQPNAASGWQTISAGGAAGPPGILATKPDGTLWAWGAPDAKLMLGAGTTNLSSPVQVGTLANWLKVSVGYRHSLAIKTDGTLWACGYGAQGQLGNGVGGNPAGLRSSPIQVGSLTNWASVSAGVHNSAAVKTDGTLWTWGQNTNGTLGIGDITNRSSPIQVGSLTDWSQIHCGRFFMAAIKTDGTLWTWGSNTFGELGNGTGGSGVQISSPVQVGSLTNWKSLAVAEETVWAIKTDRTLWAWGANDFGQLAKGDTISRSSPTQIGSLTIWKQVAPQYKAFTAITY